MKTLIVTQAVDEQDAALGFFVEWLRAFSRECDAVEVICLRKGVYTLPAHVKVSALDEQGRASFFKRWLEYLRLLRKGLSGTDLVFFHMCPEYVVAGIPALLGFRGRKVLWFTHASVTWKLRLSERFVDVVMTAAPESLRLATSKKRVMGHGIPVERFDTPREQVEGKLRLLAVGRITPVKDLMTLLKALKTVRERLPDVETTLTLVGEASRPEDAMYRERLEAFISDHGFSGAVRFAGKTGYGDMPATYAGHDILIHGAVAGLDKVVLEALASGMPVVTPNPNAGFLLDTMRVPEGDADALASAVLSLREEGWDPEKLRDIVRSEHGLDRLIHAICHEA